MTDKQIIENKNGFYCIEPCSEIKQLKEQLKAKEQQCEKAKQNAQDTYDLWQALIESFNILQGEKIKLEQECEELKINNAQFIKDNEFLAKRNSKLKAENDELKKNLNEGCLHNLTLMTEQRVLLQTLAEIKELVEKEFCRHIECCEFCANSNDCLNRKIINKINECEVTNE